MLERRTFTCLLGRLCAVFLLSLLFASVRSIGAFASESTIDESVPNPPATYYGEVLSGPGFVPVAGMPVTAWIDANICGQSLTKTQEGGVVYSVDVVGEGPGGLVGCGTPGRVVVFQVAAQFMAPTVVWDNSQLHNLPLEPMRSPVEPITSIRRSGDSLILSWPAVTTDTAGHDTLVTGYRVWRGTRPYFDPELPGCDCVLIATVTGLSYTDGDAGGVDVVGDVNANYAYMIRAANAAGESAIGKRVGEFDFALVPGSQQ